MIERQRFVFELTPCIVWPTTGDVEVESAMAEDSIADALAHGAVRTKRMRRRVKWTVSTYTTTLHDTYSPYDDYTIVPFFAYFRRGQTCGMVDDAIGPQEALNKAVSQYVHIVNTAANSGWVVEQDSLTNMSTDRLTEIGAKTGLVVEYKKGSAPPQKIQPNQVPTGVDRLIDRADKALKDVTVPEAMRGVQGPETSGVAIQAKQFASQQQLAVPLDNLAYTRRLLATKFMKLIQRYYDTHRIFRITETDPNTGKQVEQPIEINKFDPATGQYVNDVTIGTYDVVISEQPMQVTYQNSQFQQALEMRKEGVSIPDATVIRYSNLSDKHEILANMEGNTPPADPTIEAKARLLEAQAAKTQAETVDVRGKTMYSAMQSAQVIAAVPQTSGLADQLLASQGYIDQDAGPLVPQLPVGAAPSMPPEGLIPSNTDPLTPASPALGMNDGIETPGPDGVQI